MIRINLIKIRIAHFSSQFHEIIIVKNSIESRIQNSQNLKISNRSQFIININYEKQLYNFEIAYMRFNHCLNTKCVRKI